MSETPPCPEIGIGFGSTRYRIVRALAEEGYGIDDIIVRMKLGREWRATVATIVLRRIK